MKEKKESIGSEDVAVGCINPTLTAFALSRLNNVNNGDDKFEIFCQKLIPLAIDKNFFPSSGLDAGGDGGLDGWSPLGDIDKIKYAFSINQEALTKIKSEIKKIPSAEFKAVRVFTNQPVDEKEKVKIYNEAEGVAVTIYCRENLVEFVRQHPELGQFIELPKILSGITLDYARQHDLLSRRKSEIQNFLPRTFYSIEAGSSEHKEMSATDLVQNDYSLIVVHSPAGFGKTCALEQLHQGILDGTVEFEIPPAFVRLADYVPGTLRQMIDEAMAASGDYQPTNFLLLLDGYDEVPEDDRRSLNKEISRIVRNTANFRKVIVTSRDYVPAGELESIPQERYLVFLSPINRDHIDILFERMGITNRDEFWDNSFFNNFSNNIFYVVNFIQYYLDNNTIARNVHDLFSNLVSKEIARLFRTPTPPVDLAESIALYIVLNQKQSIERTALGEELPLPDNFPATFKLSHKSILEYLAARKIARQPLEQIKRIVAKGNLLIPHLTNTIGFVLNILVSDTHQGDHDKFEKLLQWCIPGSGNAKRLLQIEADKVSPQVCQDVFAAVIEQEALTSNFFERSHSLIRFMLQRQESVAPNVKTLVDRILGSKNSDEHLFFTLTMQDLCYTDINAISNIEQKRLVDFLFELLEPESIGRNHRLIESLLYIVPNLEAVSGLEDLQLQLLVERVLSLAEESPFDNLCSLLKKVRPVVDSNTYFKLYHFIIERNFRESGGMARLVPEQISDDDYQESVRYTSWYSFVPLTESFLNASHEHVWTLLKYMADNICHDDEGYGYSFRRDFEKLYKVVFSQVRSQHSRTPLTDDQVDSLVTLLQKDSEHYQLGPLWKPMRDILDEALLQKIMYRFLDREEHTYLMTQEFKSFHYEQIQTAEDFDAFMDTYEVNGSPAHKKYFREFCCDLPEDGSVTEHMLSVVSDELRKGILRRNENVAKHKEQKLSESGPKLAYSVFFSSEELIEQSEAIFAAFKTDTLSDNELFRNEQSKILEKKFPCTLFLLRNALRNSERTVGQDKIKKIIRSSDWSLNFMIPLVDYCNRKNISLNEFKPDELEATKAWASNLLEKYPVGAADVVFRQYHTTLAYVLRRLPPIDAEDAFLAVNRDRVAGLAFSGFPDVLGGGYIINYQTFSPEYLEAYLQKEELVKFIVNNFDKAFDSTNKMIAVCGYLASRLNELKPHQKHTIRKHLIRYLNDNMSRPYVSEVSNLSNEVGVQISDLDSAKFTDALMPNDRISGLEHNYAAGYLLYPNKERSAEDKSVLQTILLSAFEKHDDTFLKKTLAEYYLQMNKRAGDVFFYYANYLMSGDNPMMNRTFWRWGGSAKQLATAELVHLPKVQELFQYSTKKKKSERRDAIRDIALESYRLIAAEIDNEVEFTQVVQSMKAIAEGGNMYVYRHLQELQDAFAERSYVPLTIKEIADIA